MPIKQIKATDMEIFNLIKLIQRNADSIYDLRYVEDVNDVDFEVNDQGDKIAKHEPGDRIYRFTIKRGNVAKADNNT